MIQDGIDHAPKVLPTPVAEIMVDKMRGIADLGFNPGYGVMLAKSILAMPIVDPIGASPGQIGDAVSTASSSPLPVFADRTGYWWKVDGQKAYGYYGAGLWLPQANVASFSEITEVRGPMTLVYPDDVAKKLREDAS